MARLEQNSLRKKSYLQTKPHSRSVKSKRDYKKSSKSKKNTNQIVEHVNDLYDPSEEDKSSLPVSVLEHDPLTDSACELQDNQMANRTILVETVLESSQESNVSTSQSHMTESMGSCDSQGQGHLESNQVRGHLEGQLEGEGQENLLRPAQKDSTSSSRDSGIHKSRSSFLDETEAKVSFLVQLNMITMLLSPKHECSFELEELSC